MKQAILLLIQTTLLNFAFSQILEGSIRKNDDTGALQIYHSGKWG